MNTEERRDLVAGLPDPFRRYCDVQRSFGQLCGLIAASEGLKPVMDDWIPHACLPDFQSIAEDLGLVVLPGESFEFIEDSGRLQGVVGADLLNTTRAERSTRPGPDSRLHVHVGKDPETVAEARRSGWYDLIVAGRVVPKPYIDHHWFGHALGYPDCCLQAFAADGSWNVSNAYALAARDHRMASPVANPSMRHTGLSYVVHYPCTFGCRATVEFGEAVRLAVGRHSTELMKAVDAQVSGPFLFVSGWSAYQLVGGTIRDKQADYRSVRAVPTNAMDTDLLDKLRQGDGLEVRGEVVTIQRAGAVVAAHAVRADRYAPEDPVLVDFDPLLLPTPTSDSASR